MKYAWDENKRHLNIAKHGVDFADAVGVLEDPFSLTIEDAAAQGEARYLTLGRDLLGRVLCVVWTERRADTLRLISARKASPAQIRHYSSNLQAR